MTLRTTTRRAGATILLVATAAGLAACGDSKNASGPSTTFSNVSITGATDLKSKPKINIADELPPKSLISKDLVVGKGALVKTGDALTAQYVGVSWSTNRQFDSSWDRGAEPATFTLAKGSVIDGWTEGLPGMHVGGRRLLIIPAAKGYGDQGQGQDIPAGETLVFIVDAKKTAKAVPSTTPASSASSTLTQEQLQQAIQQSQAGGQ